MQASSADIQIIYDVCWILTPLQIQRMCSNYFVADYEASPPFLSGLHNLTVLTAPNFA